MSRFKTAEFNSDLISDLGIRIAAIDDIFYSELVKLANQHSNFRFSSTLENDQQIKIASQIESLKSYRYSQTADILLDEIEYIKLSWFDYDGASYRFAVKKPRKPLQPKPLRGPNSPLSTPVNLPPAPPPVSSAPPPVSSAPAPAPGRKGLGGPRPGLTWEQHFSMYTRDRKEWEALNDFIKNDTTYNQAKASGNWDKADDLINEFYKDKIQSNPNRAPRIKLPKGGLDTPKGQLIKSKNANIFENLLRTDIKEYNDLTRERSTKYNPEKAKIVLERMQNNLKRLKDVRTNTMRGNIGVPKFMQNKALNEELARIDKLMESPVLQKAEKLLGKPILSEAAGKAAGAAGQAAKGASGLAKAVGASEGAVDKIAKLEALFSKFKLPSGFLRAAKFAGPVMNAFLIAPEVIKLIGLLDTYGGIEKAWKDPDAQYDLINAFLGVAGIISSFFGPWGIGISVAIGAIQWLRDKLGAEGAAKFDKELEAQYQKAKSVAELRVLEKKTKDQIAKELKTTYFQEADTRLKVKAKFDQLMEEVDKMIEGKGSKGTSQTSAPSSTTPQAAPTPTIAPTTAPSTPQPTNNFSTTPNSAPVFNMNEAGIITSSAKDILNDELTLRRIVISSMMQGITDLDRQGKYKEADDVLKVVRMTYA